MASKPDTTIKPRRNGTSTRATGSVTLADVAKIAGVSPITVSRVVNRPELVTADTLAHVQQVIDRTGYVPNLLAGGLIDANSLVTHRFGLADAVEALKEAESGRALKVAIRND